MGPGSSDSGESSGRVTAKPRNLVVIDQRQLIADALAAVLVASGRFTVTTCSIDQAWGPAITAAAADLVLIFVGESHGPALELVTQLASSAPELRIVMIADSQDPELIRCVLDQGVAALVLTAVTAEELMDTLDHVLRGNTALPAGWRGTLAQSDDDPISNLSARQLEVLKLLADGCSYEEIGERLIITPNTVKFHVRTIYLRLGVRNRMAAANLLNAHLLQNVGSLPQRAHPIDWRRPTRSRGELLTTDGE